MRIHRRQKLVFEQENTIAYNGCAGFLRFMGNSRTPLWFLILSSLLNLGLDMLFVILLHTGIAGAAFATVIAQAVSAVLCGVYIFRNYREYLPCAADWKISHELSAEMFTTGFSMAMMQCVFSLGSVVLQRSINALDTDIITAHTASRRGYEMLMIPMSTISSATSTFVGQNYGAKRYRRIREANRKMLLVEFLWSVFSVLVCWTLGRPLVILLTATGNEEIISAAFLVPAIGYLGVAVTEPVIWCLCALFLAVFYVTIGHQKQLEESNV